LCGQIVCHKCHRQGHKAAQCRMGQSIYSPQQQNHQKTESFIPKCFSCGVVGHKSPSCPNRNTEPKKDDEKKEFTGKKKDKAPKQQSKVTIANSEDTNIISATLYDQPLPLLLDTGAQISVVPGEKGAVERVQG